MIIKKPRTKDKEARIKEIQNAARKIFFREGFKNATIEEIAKQTDISKGTIYLYFKSKEDLYISLMGSVTQELGKLLKKYEMEVNNNKYKNHREIIKRFLDIHYEIYKYDPDGIRIIQAFQQGDFSKHMSDENVNYLQGIARDNFSVVRRIFSKAAGLGLIRNVNPIHLCDACWGMFIGLVQLEERKFMVTKKDHLRDSLEFAFSLLADALRPINAGLSSNQLQKYQDDLHSRQRNTLREDST